MQIDAHVGLRSQISEVKAEVEKTQGATMSAAKMVLIYQGKVRWRASLQDQSLHLRAAPV